MASVSGSGCFLCCLNSLHSEVTYADDGFYVAVHEERTEALKDLEE